MDLKNINDILSRLSLMADGWHQRGSVPAIERDVALEELRRLYEELLHAEGDAALAESVGAAIAATAPAVNEIEDAIDIDALLGLTEDDYAPKQEPTPKAEPTPEVVVEVAPEVVEVAPAPIEVATEVVEVAPAPEIAPASVEVAPAPEIIPEPIEVAPTPIEVAPAPVVEPVVEPMPEPAPQPQTVAIGGGLFDIDDIPVRTKSKRKIISLYSTPTTHVVESAPKAEPAPQPTPAHKEEPQSAPTPKPMPKPAPQPVQPSAPARLGDVLGGGVTTLADKMADDAQPTQPMNRISDLRKAIGLNDKFLMIRDLFDGDAERYEDTIDTLNEFDDLDECMIYIIENFAWNPDSEGAKLLVSLIERKLA